MTIWNCRSAFQATAIFPYNPQLVLKTLPQQRTYSALISEREIRVRSAIGNSHTQEATGSIFLNSDIEDPLQTTPLDSPEIPSSLQHFPTTPHNPSTIQSHVVNILDQLTDLEVDGVSINTPSAKEYSSWESQHRCQWSGKLFSLKPIPSCGNKKKKKTLPL